MTGGDLRSGPVTDEELIAAACPKIGAMGPAFYFVPSTLERGKELGLDGFRFYFLGRGGVLGDVEAPVVASAFGYFEPTLVASMWNSAREVVDPREGGREHLRCCQDFGREKFADARTLEPFCAAAGAVNEAARAHSAALALYAAVSAEPLAEDPPARAMQLLTTLREFRGSAHLVAVVASMLTPRMAHFLARPEMYATFGWSDDDRPPVTDEDRAHLQAAERLTDRLVAPAYGVLDEDGRRALCSGLEELESCLAPSAG